MSLYKWITSLLAALEKWAICVLLNLYNTFMESVLFISSKTALRVMSSWSSLSVAFLSCLREYNKGYNIIFFRSSCVSDWLSSSWNSTKLTFLYALFPFIPLIISTFQSLHIILLLVFSLASCVQVCYKHMDFDRRYNFLLDGLIMRMQWFELHWEFKPILGKGIYSCKWCSTLIAVFPKRGQW